MKKAIFAALAVLGISLAVGAGAPAANASVTYEQNQSSYAGGAG
jgi:hypothetical protein